MSATTSILHFSTPKKQKPNPHPYAIKTTSTALLSRNTSSSSTPSTAHHYIPPSSPSPSPTQTGFEKHEERRYTRHRYSRSLTSESPRPLPAPPSAAAALGSFNDDDDTPRRKAQRAYSLPQEIELPQDPKRWTPSDVSLYLTSTLNTGHDLPAPVARDIATFVRDNKITGKSFLRLNEVDLEGYGINQLWRTTLVAASRALRKNVLHGRIWGTEQYDGLNEGDDENNNISSNSNFNRQRSLSTTSETRGRVRDMIDTLERSSSASSSELDEEGSGTLSSRPRKDSSKRDKVHHKNRSLEQQQQQGRLPQRGSVNNLFGSGSGEPEAQSEREIEDKDDTITAHTRRNGNGNEPRLLPFPPTGPLNSNHAGYAHILTPSHTGTSYPLPASPEIMQNQQYYLDPNHALNTQLLQPFTPQLQPNAFDYYELGFKNSLPISSTSPTPLVCPPVRSPNSQRYIVQHNNVNVQPSSTPGGGGGSAGNKRLLPYPRIVGEAELFHPRPRMGLGVGGLASGLEDGLDDKGVEGEGGDESVDLDAQIQSSDSESGAGETGADVKGSTAADAGIPGSGTVTEPIPEIEASTEAMVKDEDEAKEPTSVVAEEEPSIQELLLAQSQVKPHTISGVEAWEMELGETVKRISSSGALAAGGGDNIAGSIRGIGGSKTRTRPKKREVMMAEIGRKSGRAGVGVGLGLEGGKKRMTGVLDLGLFEEPELAAGDVAHGGSIDHQVLTTDSAPPAPDSSTSTSSTFASASPSTSTLILRESSIATGRECSPNVRQFSIAEREPAITAQESDIAQRGSSQGSREYAINDQSTRKSPDSMSFVGRYGIQPGISTQRTSFHYRESVEISIQYSVLSAALCEGRVCVSVYA